MTPGSPTTGLTVEDFDFDLPERLIAQHPPADRTETRMLVLDRKTGQVSHSRVSHLPDKLRPGDLVVVNNTLVIPARLFGTTETGGACEFLLLRQGSGETWRALAKPSRRLPAGKRLSIRSAADPGLAPVSAEIEATFEGGLVDIRFEPPDHPDWLSRYGDVPLPPYIREPLTDPADYQTSYASRPGSAAAPTAGFHLVREVRAALAERGIGWAEVTLHVGLDTFRPVTADHIAQHTMHSEWCEVPKDTAARIRETRKQGGRVVAIGTTTVRTLESFGKSTNGDANADWSGFTDLFITPGFRWTMVDAMLTNFHLPRSTLLMMISAFAGREAVLHAYREAVNREYRFFSFGDAMLILQQGETLEQ